MGECSICGARVEGGHDHTSTTDCIRHLRSRIAALEGAISHLVPPKPLVYPPQS